MDFAVVLVDVCDGRGIMTDLGGVLCCYCATRQYEGSTALQPDCYSMDSKSDFIAIQGLHDGNYCVRFQVW